LELILEILGYNEKKDMNPPNVNLESTIIKMPTLGSISLSQSQIIGLNTPSGDPSGAYHH
jgi:hypothetical protein